MLALIAGGIGVMGSAAESSKPEALPVTHDAPNGQRFRLAAYKPEPGDDVATSWCLRLRYTAGIIVDGNPFTGGLATCGVKPAPRVSGAYVADCAHNILYVFGAMRRAVDGVEVVRADGRAVPASVAVLPKGSGFSGRSFVAAITMVHFPATVRETSGRRTRGARLALRRDLCAAPPGRPEPEDGGSSDFAWHTDT